MPSRRRNSGTLRLRGQTWTSQIRDPRTGRQRTKSWPGLTQRQAERQHAAWTATILARGGTDRITVAAHLDEWLVAKKPNVSPATYRNVRVSVDRIKDECGAMQLDDITPRIVQQVIAAWQGQGAARTTISLRKSHWSDAMNTAVHWQRIPTNPVAVVRLRQQPRPTVDHRVITDDEMRRIIAAEPHPMWRAWWALHAATGCRPGETLALRWGDIDGPDITISRTVTDDENGRQTVGEHTKTRKDRRVRVSDTALEHLAVWRRELAGKNMQLVRADAWLWPAPGRVDSPVVMSTVGRAWAEAKERADVDRRRTLHGVRHWHASGLAMSGAPSQLAAKRLGHGAPMFDRLYGVHSTQEAVDGIAGLVPDYTKEA